MVRKVSGIVAAASVAAVALGGCAEEPEEAIGPCIYPALTRADIATVGEPGPADLPFGEALVTYSRRLGTLHVGGDHTDARIRRAVRDLARILERVPAAAAEPHLRHAAGLMRAATEPEEPSIEDTKRALAVAAKALLELAERDYREVPEVASLTRNFAGAVTAIDTDHNDQAAAIDALIRAERALAAMYAADVLPPRSVIDRPQP